MEKTNQINTNKLNIILLNRIVILCLCLVWSKMQAQTELPRIDKEKLKAILDTSTARLNILTIFTNDCGGTRWMFQNIKEIKSKYPGQILFIPCSSERNAQEHGVIELLNKYSYTDVVGDFIRANSSLFISRKKFETVIKTIIKQ